LTEIVNGTAPGDKKTADLTFLNAKKYNLKKGM
jgi:hypothetical protein